MIYVPTKQKSHPNIETESDHSFGPITSAASHPTIDSEEFELSKYACF